MLATAIAETSITLEGVSVVVDAGLSRRAEFDLAAGVTHLITTRASQAAAAQRAGRAARLGPGVAYRLWEEAAHPGRETFDPPEMLDQPTWRRWCLRCAQWGVADPAIRLPGSIRRPPRRCPAARDRLAKLGALDGRRADHRARPPDRRAADGAVAGGDAAFGAEHGAASEAAKLALLLQERGLGGRGEDLAQRLARWNGDRSPRADGSRKLAASGWAQDGAAKSLERRIRRGQLLPPLRYPPRAGAARQPRPAARCLGRKLALRRRARLLARRGLATRHRRMAGDRRRARPRAGGADHRRAAADTEEVERWLGGRIERRSTLRWTGERVEARLERRIGAIMLASGPDPAPDPRRWRICLSARLWKTWGNCSRPACSRGPASPASRRSIRRGWRQEAGEWLAPLLDGRRDLDVPKGALAEALLDRLSWDERQRLDKLAPREFATPAGTHHPIDYAGDDAPSVEVRVQALFGLERHPMIGDTPLLLKLTSPAGRPLQATRDLPGFWRG